MGRFLDRTGLVYGNLTVLYHDKDRKIKNHGSYWFCRCEPCGRVVSIRGTNLTSGNTTSCCGDHKKGSSNKNWTGYEGISGSYWASLKKDALRRGLQFDLQIEEAWEVYVNQGGRCALSGREIKIYTPGVVYNEASLDRINSSNGYSKDNVQWVHKKINQIKMDLSQDEFIALCQQVTKYQQELDDA